MLSVTFYQIILYFNRNYFTGLYYVHLRIKIFSVLTVKERTCIMHVFMHTLKTYLKFQVQYLNYSNSWIETFLQVTGVTARQYFGFYAEYIMRNKFWILKWWDLGHCYNIRIGHPRIELTVYVTIQKVP